MSDFYPTSGAQGTVLSRVKERRDAAKAALEALSDRIALPTTMASEARTPNAKFDTDLSRTGNAERSLRPAR
jgi:hypothetical protein